MKIINLGRCQGKTTRLLYASEFNNIPILVATFQQKDFGVMVGAMVSLMLV